MANRFATLAYLELHACRGDVQFLNAGHIPPLVVTRSGATAREPVALPLGIVPEAVYIEESLVLAPGDSLVLVSDGVTEATNVREEMFGHDRLLELASQSYHLTPEALGRAITRAVDRFIEGARPTDDLSIVIARFTGVPET
jgi:sigma-B regulation protein RsbU (phosphoserine phosphatase)